MFVADHGSDTSLYVRKMAAFDARVIAGTEGASGPFFAPDGHSVGFIASGAIKKVALSGGAPVTLIRGVSPVTGGAVLTSDDSVIINSSINAGLSRFVTDAEEKTRLTEPSVTAGEGSHRWPHLLPGGEAVLFVIDRGGSFDEATIAVVVSSG